VVHRCLVLVVLLEAISNIGTRARMSAPWVQVVSSPKTKFIRENESLCFQVQVVLAQYTPTTEEMQMNTSSTMVQLSNNTFNSSSTLAAKVTHQEAEAALKTVRISETQPLILVPLELFLYQFTTTNN